VLLLLSCVELCRLRAVSRDCRTWGNLLLAHIGFVIRHVDHVARVPPLHRFAGTVSDLKATYCTAEDSGSSGVELRGEQASAELVDCVIRKNEDQGVRVYGGKLMLRGGKISENIGISSARSLARSSGSRRRRST